MLTAIVSAVLVLNLRHKIGSKKNDGRGSELMYDEKANSRERLLRVLNHLKISQLEFAVELGITNEAIVLWESKKRTVPTSILRLNEFYEAD